jgi:hypothetical protein
MDWLDSEYGGPPWQPIPAADLEPWPADPAAAHPDHARAVYGYSPYDADDSTWPCGACGLRGCPGDAQGRGCPLLPPDPTLGDAYLDRIDHDRGWGG